MFTITKQFSFSASHQLDHLPDTHKCARLHGHNYEVTLILEADSTDERGFVVDYGDLDSFKQLLDQHFDHRHLNEVMGCSQLTTAEHLAHYFYMWLRNRFHVAAAVTVSETAKTVATYRQRAYGDAFYRQDRSVLRPPWNRISDHAYDLLFEYKPLIGVWNGISVADYLKMKEAGHAPPPDTVIIPTDEIDKMADLQTTDTLQRYANKQWGAGLMVKEFTGTDGQPRYVLMNQYTLQVLYAGKMLCTISQLVKHPNIMDKMSTTKRNAWEQAFEVHPITLAPMPTLPEQHTKEFPWLTQVDQTDLIDDQDLTPNYTTPRARQAFKKGFSAMSFTDPEGVTRWMLVAQSKYVYLNGSYFGITTDVMFEHWRQMETDKNAIWEHQPSITPYFGESLSPAEYKRLHTNEYPPES